MCLTGRFGSGIVAGWGNAGDGERDEPMTTNTLQTCSGIHFEMSCAQSSAARWASLKMGGTLVARRAEARAVEAFWFSDDEFAATVDTTPHHQPWSD